MLADFLRHGEYRQVLDKLIATDPLCKLWAPVVKQLVRHTVLRLFGKFYCFSYFKTQFTYQEVSDLVAKIMENPFLFDFEFGKQFIAITNNVDSGVDAQIEAIKICCSVFDYKKLDFAENVTNSLDQMECVNIYSIHPINFRTPIPFGFASDPMKYEFIIRSTCSAAAPPTVPDVKNCYICLAHDIMSASDHKCACRGQEVHYGCFRMYEKVTHKKVCPMCGEVFEMPVNLLVDEIFQAEVTGADMESIALNVRKMDRKRTTYPGNPQDFFNANAQVIRTLEFGGDLRFMSPDLTLRGTYDQRFPNSKAGLKVNTKSKNSDLRFTRAPTKKQVYEDACEQMWLELRAVYDTLKKQNLKPGELANLLSEHWYKIAFKVEALMREVAGPGKQRSFFMPMACKFFLDKILMAPGVKFRYNKKWIMVGHKWHRGGARRLFDELRGTFPGQRPTHYFFEWDLSGMDQSVKALQIIMNMLMFTFDYEDGTIQNDQEVSFEFYVLRQLFYWSADNSAVHDTKWFGKYAWKRIVGILFSGEYMTSISNTMTSGVLFYAWLFCNRRLLKEFIAKFPTSPLVSRYETYIYALEKYIKEIIAKFFGDDGIAAIPIILVRVLSLSDSIRKTSGLPEKLSVCKTFEDFLRDDCDMALKVKESSEYAQLYTVVKNDEITLRGPKILKRHFMLARVCDELTVVAWRPCQLWKIALPTLQNMTLPHQILRLIGHLLDTQGNNIRQYTMVENCIRMTLARIPEYKDYESFMTNYMLNEKSYNSESVRKEFEDKLMRLLGDDVENYDFRDFITKIPTIGYLQHFFNKPDLTFYEKPTYMSWYEMQAHNKT